MQRYDKPDQSARHPRFIKTLGTLLVVLFFCLPLYAQPSNDECTGATVITSIPFTDNVNTTTATSNPADPSLSCNGSGAKTDGNTVWYVWTPPADITVNISTDGSTAAGGGPLDTAHGVFTGSCGALTEVACVDVGLTDNLIFDATGGVTYFIKFGEFLDGAGGGNLLVTVDVPPPPEQFVLESVRDGVSDPLSSLVTPTATTLTKRSEATATAASVKEVPLFMRDQGKAGASLMQGATFDLLQKKAALKGIPFHDIETSSAGGGGKQATLLQIFDGAENDDNDALTDGLVFPPDTDGDVGSDHYVQIINSVTTIFDKSGNTVLGPFPNNAFWTGLGGDCEATNQGDPIVLYDEETERWFVSQFAFPNNFSRFSLCMAISTSDDPTGSYFQHEFDFSSIGFPDYPKYGFVSDAIGVMVNFFTPPFFGFGGVGLGAIDKEEAFSPGPTTMVLFQTNTNEFGFLPADNDGPEFDDVPPTFFTNNGGSGNRIDIWEIEADFEDPGNSTISEVARIPVDPFDTDLCNAVRERCIDQPEGAPRLEAITDRLMHRLQIRNFGNEMRAMVNHTVDTDGNGKAGIRWYDFRKKKKKGWKLKKQNTFSPDGDHRWMGSIAMNEEGRTCLGYSISSTTTYPSIGVASRKGGSANLDELVVFDGNVDQFVQLGTAARWGDYSAMAVDPEDGTFWYTTEYAKPNTRLGELAGWATKIVQVTLDDNSKNDNEDVDKTVVAAAALAEQAAGLENYPNPFNPETEIRFKLPEASHVTIRIYNSLGQEIRKLADQQYQSGSHSLRWDSKDNRGHKVSSGLYFYELQTGAVRQVRKMTLVR